MRSLLLWSLCVLTLYSRIARSQLDFASDTKTFNASKNWEVGSYGVKETKENKVGYCILMTASMQLHLTYQHLTDKDGKNSTEKTFKLPVMQVNDPGSSCGWMGYPSTSSSTVATTVQSDESSATTQAALKLAEATGSTQESAGNQSSPVTHAPGQYNSSSTLQRLELKFWEDWRLGLVFTSNSGDKAFELYSVDLKANLRRLPHTFENVTDDGYDIDLVTNLTANANSDYWKAISAMDKGKAEKCLHIQSVTVTDDLTLDFVNLTVIAFADNIQTMPDDTETCPSDLPVDDTIDIIIGAIMSGVVTLVMIIYLFYRLKKGPSKIPAHLMPRPAKQSVSTSAEGAHHSVNSADKY